MSSLSCFSGCSSGMVHQAPKRAMKTSMLIMLPLMARSAVIASSSLRKPASVAAFMVPRASPLALRKSNAATNISPALRGGNGEKKTSLLAASRQFRAHRMMNQASMTSSTPAAKTDKELEWPADKVKE